MPVNWKPEGFSTVMPYLTLENPAAAIDFAQNVFDAEVLDRIETEDGVLVHAELRIGEVVIMLATARGDWPAMPSGLYVYVPDTDAAYARAIAAGGRSLSEPFDEFYGDRVAGVADVCGNNWWIATHVETLTPEEMERREATFLAKRSNR